MRMISAVLLIAMMLQLPFPVGEEAVEAVSAALPATVSAEQAEETLAAPFAAVTVCKDYGIESPAAEEAEEQAQPLQVQLDAALAPKEQSPEATLEESPALIVKEIVKAKAIDTSKPVLQTPVGTLAGAPTKALNYPLTDAERDLIERVIMSEAGGASYNDMLAVAQCIYDRSRAYGLSITATINAENAFSDPSKKTPNSNVKRAVEDVFTNGRRVTVEPILYFCAARAAKPGSFHESQTCLYVTSVQRYYGRA